MALLTDTKSRRKPSKKNLTESGSSPEPQSLPDLDTLKRIESLERELAEAKASGEASRQEVETLKQELEETKKKTAAAPAPQVQQVTKTDDRPERKSFFGV